MHDDTLLDGLNGLEIAIVGMAGRFPGANDLDIFWENVRNGIESLSTFSEEELAASGVSPSLLQDLRYVRSRGVLDGASLFDAPFFGFYPREAQILDPQQRVFLECAWEALENAGYDPTRFPGSIGVFAGASTNGYFTLLANSPAIRAVTDDFQLLLSTDKDYLATRVSYKLGLSGPSYTVQTACSTSLVATHLACQSLLNGECDMALAGGVSIMIPQRAGYMAVTGGVLSPDGHCRAFDARAEGTLGGDGVGIVTLRRLQDALAAGDTIRAVIKGSAINNDGDRKVGFTAPSVEGQARVIRAAHIAAEVEPETISYVEAHGTATPLGDPIEVAALTQAFRYRTHKRGFCGIGSVKTNIGHLDVAAGVAGLIKTTLALEHRELPPSLHFERPNPEIDFNTSPFFVNATQRPWESDNGPRRAGVSAFGVGGTNAHIVLEEAPLLPPSGPSRVYQLLTLSAKTDAALERSATKLAAHLRHRPDYNLADVAYTLQVGRRAFDQRQALVCAETAEAAKVLEGQAADMILSGAPFVPSRSVVFMFPGGGAQYANMAHDLYLSEPLFREQVDRCAELLAPHLKLDLRDVLYPALDMAPRTAINENTVFPAALFTIEYALARLWMAWGVQPQAMIGHSLGEYVAACLAGVFTLEDALAIVALRGQLFDQLPAGAMLSSALSARELEPLLPPGVTLAVINAPRSCVASGPCDGIDELERRLAGRAVDYRRLHLTIAGHSPAIDRVAGIFEQFIRSRRLSPPQLPFLSNVTGTWITAEQTTDPSYWALHLRQTVRFSEGIVELLRQPDRAFLEVGPGWTLSSLVHAHRETEQPPFAVTSLRHAQDDQPDTALLLGALGRLWVAGVDIDWTAFYRGQRRRRLPLPGYAFERQHHWPELALARSPFAVENAPVTHKSMPEDTLSSPAPARAVAKVDAKRHVEGRLSAIWRALFGIEQIGADSNFFDLGGHSLLATRVLFAINEAFGVDLPLKALLRAPTVAQLTTTIEQARDSAVLPDTPSLDPAAEVWLDETIVPPPDTGDHLPSAGLLTGATGYLGAYLLHELLRQTAGDVFCLVRATDSTEGLARLRRTLQSYQIWDDRDAARIIPVIGDLEQPLLGLSEDCFRGLARRIGAIYHCGARVHFTYPYASLKANNVLGTQEILRLAACERLKPVHHISTTAVFAPHSTGSNLITEDDPLPNVDALPTGYAQSKWVAEKIIDIARARGMSVAVYRPGAVTGDTRTSMCRPDDAVWRLLKSCIQLGVAPEIESEIASAPVDYVSRAIVAIAQHPGAIGKHFHLTAPNMTPWRDIFAAARSLGYSLQPVDYAGWRAALASLKSAEDNALFPLIHLFDRDQPEAPHRFDCQNTLQALLPSGIVCPPLDAELVQRYCAYFMESGFLAPPRPSAVSFQRADARNDCIPTSTQVGSKLHCLPSTLLTAES
jgi:phthiocerol/phenolphthiocerol synthesis type-I polyketide synthase E